MKDIAKLVTAIVVADFVTGVFWKVVDKCPLADIVEALDNLSRDQIIQD